jgi:hypothetical protein
LLGAHGLGLGDVWADDSSFGFSFTEPVMSVVSILFLPGKLKVSCAQDGWVDSGR